MLQPLIFEAKGWPHTSHLSPCTPNSGKLVTTLTLITKIIHSNDGDWAPPSRGSGAVFNKIEVEQ